VSERVTQTKITDSHRIGALQKQLQGAALADLPD